MSSHHEMYGHVQNSNDLHRVFREIRQDVDAADSRPVLTELYRRGGYLITLTYAPSWIEKFGTEVQALRQTAEAEFRLTAQRINQRAAKIGTEADYHETWGHR